MGSSGVDPDNCDGADLLSFEDEAGEEECLLPDMAKLGKRVGHTRLSGDAVAPHVASRSKSDLLVSQFLAKMQPTCSRGRRNNSRTAADCRRGHAQHGHGEVSSSSRVSVRQSDRTKKATEKRAACEAANRRGSSRGSTSSHNFSLSPAEPSPPSHNKFIMLPKCIAFVSSATTSRRDDPRRLIGNYGEAYSVKQGHLLLSDRHSDWGSNSALISVSSPAFSGKDSDNLDPAFENDVNRRGETTFEHGSQKSTSTRRSEADGRKPNAEVKSAASWAVKDLPASYVRAGVEKEEHQATCFEERPLGRVISSSGPDAADPSVRKLPNLPRRSQATATGAYHAGDHLSHPPLVSSSPGAPVNAAVRASEGAQQNVLPPQTKNKTVENDSTPQKKSLNVPPAVMVGTIELLPEEKTHQDGYIQPRNCSKQHLRSDIAESNKSGADVTAATTAGGDDIREQPYHPQLPSLSCASRTEVPKGEQARHKEPPSEQQQRNVVNCEPASPARLSNSHAMDDGTMDEVLPSLSSKQGSTEPSTPDASVNGGSHRKDRSCLQPMSSTYGFSVIKALTTKRAQREHTLPQQQQQQQQELKIVSHQLNSKPKSSSPAGEETVGLSPKPTPTSGVACKGGTFPEPSSSAPATAAAADYATEILIDRWSDGEERESWENALESHVLPVKERQAVGDNKPKSDPKAERGKCGNLSMLSPTLRHDSVDWMTYDRRHASPHRLSGINTRPIGNGRCSSSPRSIESSDNLWRGNAIRREIRNENRKKFRDRIWNMLEDNGGPMPFFTVVAELKKMPRLHVGMTLKELFREGYMEGVVRYCRPPGSTLYLAIEGRGHEPRSWPIDQPGQTGVSGDCTPTQTYSYYGPSPQVPEDVKRAHDEGRTVRSPRETSVSSEDMRRRSHTKRGRRLRTPDSDSDSSGASPKRYFPRSTKRGRGLSHRRSSSRSCRGFSLDTSSSPDGGKGGSRDEKSYRRSGRYRRGHGRSDDDSDTSLGRYSTTWSSTSRGSSYGYSSRSRRSLSSDFSSSPDRGRRRSRYSNKKGHSGRYCRGYSSESSTLSDTRRLTRKLENRRGREEAAPRGTRSDSFESSMSSDSSRRRREVGPWRKRYASRRRKANDRKKRDCSEGSKGSGTDKTRASKDKIVKSAVKKRKKLGKDAPCEQSKGNDASVNSFEMVISSASKSTLNEGGDENVRVGDDTRSERKSSSSAATAMEVKVGDGIKGNDQGTKKIIVALGDDARPERQRSSSAATAMGEKCGDMTEAKDENSVVNVGDDARPEGQTSTSAPEAADEKGGDANGSEGQETKKNVDDSVEGRQLELKSSSSATEALQEKGGEGNEGEEQKMKKNVLSSCDHAKSEQQNSSSTIGPMSTSTRLGEGRHGIRPTMDVKTLSMKKTTRRPDNEAGACNGSSAAASKKSEKDEIAGPTTTDKTPKKKMKLSIKPFTMRKKPVASLFRQPR